MIVRNYVPGEPLPANLATGYESCRSDPRWIWLAIDESTGVPCAILVAAPAHITVIFLRLVVVDEAHPTAIRVLLTEVLRECVSRGYPSYMTWVDPQRPVEASLLRLLRNHRGIQLTMPQVACIGLTDFNTEDVRCHS